MTGFSQEELTFLRHHLFLPPGLPQEDDHHAVLDEALLKLVIGALWDFKDLISEEERPLVHHVAAAINRLKQTRNTKDGVLNEEELLEALEEMSEADGPVTIPLHIRAQNAGIIFSTCKKSDGVLFQAFEVSPTNNAAMGTQGRLRRCFPGPVLCIDKEQFKKPDLLSTLAKTLSKMSLQEAPDMTPTVKKSGNNVKETRDTTDPGLVTELIVAFLQPFSSIPIAQKIWKHTREEVLWNHAYMPWRRSPLWLFLRTVMQLLFTQSQADRSSEPGSVTGGCLYKTFMIYLLARVLSESIGVDASTEPDILSCMSAKIHRRKLKSNHAEHGSVNTFVQGILDRTQYCLEKRWSRIQELDKKHLDLDCLRSLKFENDVSLSLPGLDGFLSSIPKRSSANNSADFSPSSDLLKLTPGSLPPKTLFKSANYMVYNLHAFELWVALHLSGWLAANLEGKGSCEALKESMKMYHEAAQKAYKGNPETSSIMFLTLLELWRACDKSALAIFPMLHDYDPDVQLEPLQSLILPLKEDMVRLLNMEEYLRIRRTSARLGSEGSIFRDFGTPDCFSVRFYDASWKHKEILQRIEDAATDERRKRCEELSEKKMKYQSLVQQYQQSTCDTNQVYNNYGNLYRAHAHNNCHRCALKTEFDSIRIAVHEWPLPTKNLEKKSVVFELDPPQAFCAWRDATSFLHLDVFDAAYDGGSEPGARFPLDSYDPLRDYYVVNVPRRLGLLSEDKPHLVTYRNELSIPYTTEQDICVNNGLHFRYYDASEGCFVANFSHSDKVPEMCTYQLPEKASTLQPFLFRKFQGRDSTPNEVISSQSECPENMSLEEYKYLSDIPVCYRLQWKKILSQLASPAVDFKKPETSLVIFQAIYQAGPRKNEGFQRASHFRLADEKFTEALLSAVDVATGRIKKNWESYQALSAFSCIVTRQLSLSPSPELTAKALKVLSNLREVAFGWLENLLTKRDDTVDKGRRAEFAEKIVAIAMICSGTFDVDGQHLDRILLKTNDASILIQCGIQIHELLLPRDVASQSSLMSILHRRWERLSYRAYPKLLGLGMVVHNEARTCLDHAVTNYWSEYQRLGCWEAATSHVDHWVVSNTDGGSELSLRVQFNLLTGDLLVNGLPLSRPPSQYENHTSYIELFGGVILQIMPGSVAGMQFSSRQCYAGHSLHLGLDGSDLLIRATRDNHAFELVPKRVFHGKLPSTFIDDFIHWFDITEGTVQFRSIRQPWTSATDTWILEKDDSRWKLSKHESTLISPHSPTGKKLASIFAPLQNPLQINITLSVNDQTLEVDLPRLKLAFGLERGGSSVLSHQFRGMEIDCEQFIGTLIGLKNKLVLRNVTTGDRRVIIPFGKVSVARETDHVLVDIDPSPVSTHVYRLDTILKLGLRDNGNLQSMLFLCYLHAITSFCLPDPSICITGTEKSLVILKSATVWSTVSTALLTEENMTLLGLIEALTPRRVYYPENLQVMETIGWNAHLPVLSQHSQFHQCVMDLWSQNKLTQLYHPEANVEPPRVVDVNSALLRRDNLRSSTFRISGVGAEDFSDEVDVIYQSRDLGQSSNRSKQAGLAAVMLFHRHPHLQYRVPNFVSPFLTLLKDKSVSTVQGPDNPEATESTLDYDGMWLNDHPKHWADLWCWLHRQSQSASSYEIKDPRLMMWLATMAFSSKADMDFIQIAASLFSIPQLKNVQPPQVQSFHLQEGDYVDEDVLRNMILPRCIGFKQSPEANFLGSASDEEWRRKEAMYEDNKSRAIDTLKRHLASQWPSPSPEPPSGYKRQSICIYVNIDRTMRDVEPKFQVWYDNMLFTKYIQHIGSVIDILSVERLSVASLHFQCPRYTPVRMKTYIRSADLFESAPSDIVPAHPKISKESLQSYLRGSGTSQRSSQSASSAMSKLESLIQICKLKAGSPHEKKYADDLSDSRDSLRSDSGVPTSMLDFKPKLRLRLDEHLFDSKRHANLVFETIKTTMLDILRSRFSVGRSSPGPRISPIFLLRQLSHGGWDSRDGWRFLPAAWKPWIVAYGLALTEVQRAMRLINSLHNPLDFERELMNVGHENWDPLDFPESLLLEIESDIMIRPVQEQIAANMRQPPGMHNAVMQLNMGEGKSSVIAPVVTAALADGSRLVRVVVAKPQSRQMFHMLVSKLGGLLNRRIFQMPFSRDLQLRLTIPHARAIQDECQRCIDVGGIMLVQPEHILSFKLMGLQSLITGKDEAGESIGQSLLQTQRLFDTESRDIVDESDENFSVKFELIYTMGMQGPIEFAPDRWVVIQKLLNLIKKHAKGVRAVLPQSIEVIERHSGSFPKRIRLLKEDATEMLLSQVAQDVCNDGFSGFPIRRQPETSRQSVLKYISRPELSQTDIDNVEKGVFWTETTRHHLLLLRGLFAGGIFAFAFGQKRWRVNYGLDKTRRPKTKLAVPFRAKDLPTQRSEFSHPDVVITLTCNCYYYEGLNDEELFLSFAHLLRSDQAAAEYYDWTRDSHNLPPAFEQLTGVNMKDTLQCTQELFPAFRYAKRTIDYYLQFLVFPKYMKEFPQKLSTSGWDIGAAKSHPTTGFSGTVDSRAVLPLDVNYLALPEQNSTNALVLQNLLRPENGVILLDRTSKPDVEDDSQHSLQQTTSEAESFLGVVVSQRERPIRVILDVGAQILEMTNAQVATRWLEMAHAQDSAIRGSIFFDDNEELVVVDIHGFTENLRTSPYGEQLDVCLVFLDEAHTRGTDLKLPQDYRAAVTLGASLTRDRLAQACMRLRKLGQGQSVVFCIPEEIQTKIKERMSPGGDTDTMDTHIDMEHVLEWAISETHKDTRKSMPLWAAQGQRFERQRRLWDEARTGTGKSMTVSQANGFLEEEAQTLEQRYRPKPPFKYARLNGEATTERLGQIQARCDEVGSTKFDEATLQEEQERELSPEAEQERQLERPPPAKAARHDIHPDLRAFVASGILCASSPAFMPAFESLRDTSAAQHLNVSMFPKDVLVTVDFARTVKKTAISGSVLDAYQRPVQWILTSQPHNWHHIVIVSPHEAHELLPEIESSGKTTLHLYAPRSNPASPPLDGLDVYTVPSSSMHAMTPPPMYLKLQLNLFAGQLYFKKHSEYVDFCNMLRLSWQESSEGVEIAPDGFILSWPPRNLQEPKGISGPIPAQSSTFTKSPVKFLKDFLMKARRDCQSIEKTHLGRLLDGALLEKDDFES